MCGACLEQNSYGFNNIQCKILFPIEKKIIDQTYPNPFACLYKEMFWNSQNDPDVVGVIKAFSRQTKHRLFLNQGLNNVQVGAKSRKKDGIDAYHHVHGTLKWKKINIFYYFELKDNGAAEEQTTPKSSKRNPFLGECIGYANTYMRHHRRKARNSTEPLESISGILFNNFQGVLKNNSNNISN